MHQQMHNAGKNSINEACRTLSAMLALNAFHCCAVFFLFFLFFEILFHTFVYLLKILISHLNAMNAPTSVSCVCAHTINSI